MNAESSNAATGPQAGANGGQQATNTQRRARQPREFPVCDRCKRQKYGCVVEGRNMPCLRCANADTPCTVAGVVVGPAPPEKNAPQAPPNMPGREAAEFQRAGSQASAASSEAPLDLAADPEMPRDFVKPYSLPGDEEADLPEYNFREWYGGDGDDNNNDDDGDDDNNGDGDDNGHGDGNNNNSSSISNKKKKNRKRNNKKNKKNKGKNVESSQVDDNNNTDNTNNTNSGNNAESSQAAANPQRASAAGRPVADDTFVWTGPSNNPVDVAFRAFTDAICGPYFRDEVYAFDFPDLPAEDDPMFLVADPADAAANATSPAATSPVAASPGSADNPLAFGGQIYVPDPSVADEITMSDSEFKNLVEDAYGRK